MLLSIPKQERFTEDYGSAHQRRIRDLLNRSRLRPPCATRDPHHSREKRSWCRNFLSDHPNVRLHFTPTYSSWLNQFEIWFARIEREVISRGVFSFVSDLARKLRRISALTSAHAKLFRWKYSDPS